MRIRKSEQEHFFFVLNEHYELITELEQRYGSLSEDIQSGITIFKDAKHLEEVFSNSKHPRVNPLVEVFCAGIMFGLFHTMTENINPEFSKELLKVRGRVSVKQGRWKRVEAIKERLIAQAEAKWEAGDLLLHNEMADELLENNPKAAQSISKPVLLAALKPIAAKHGKVRGMKGVRKEKLPPK